MAQTLHTIANEASDPRSLPPSAEDLCSIRANRRLNRRRSNCLLDAGGSSSLHAHFVTTESSGCQHGTPHAAVAME